MDINIILRTIVAHSQGDAMLRAAKELRRPQHSDETLWRLYRQAMAEPQSQYPEDVLEAMQAHNKKMEDALPHNKTTTLQIRLTENEREIIHMVAKECGMTVSEYVRKKCLDNNDWRTNTMKECRED